MQKHTHTSHDHDTEADIQADLAVGGSDQNESPEDLADETFPKHAQHIRSVEQLNSFFEDNFDTMARAIGRKCSWTKGESDDVLQELYPRMRNVLGHSEDGILEPWAVLHTVARRLAVDEIRRAAVRSRRLSPFHDDSHLASVDDVEAPPDSGDELREQLELGVAQLSDRERGVITGLFFQGRRGRDFARDSGLSESYVAELKSRALSRLREVLVELATECPGGQTAHRAVNAE